MKKPLILGFYGKSKAGKTTLITQLIKKLTLEDFVVVTVKITNKSINIDTIGKDTWKYAEAGSKFIILSSKNETDYIIKRKESIDNIIENIIKFHEVDIIFIEGINDIKTPKIRIGNIKNRENTILTYKNNIEKLLRLIKEMINQEKNI